jgi:hypothetical protein
VGGPTERKSYAAVLEVPMARNVGACAVLLAGALWIGLTTITAGQGQAVPPRTTADLEKAVGDLQAATISTQLRCIRRSMEDLPLETQFRARALVALASARQRVDGSRLALGTPADIAEIGKSMDTFVGVLRSATWQRRDEQLKDAIAQGAARYQAVSDQSAQSTDPLARAGYLSKALIVLSDCLDDCVALHARYAR